MRTTSTTILVCILATACNRSPAGADAARPEATATADGAPDASASRLTTAEEARAAFLSAWNLLVLPHVRESERESMASIDQAMRDAPEKLTAKLEPCHESRALVERMNAQCRYDFVVYGALAELDRDGDCWSVMYEGGMKLEAIGYLDPTSGRLLLVWRVPEG
jgi:hypothetical protein